MGIKKDQLGQGKKSGRAEDHAKARAGLLVRKPEQAVYAMSREKEGVAFSKEEIAEYIQSQARNELSLHEVADYTDEEISSDSDNRDTSAWESYIESSIEEDENIESFEVEGEVANEIDPYSNQVEVYTTKDVAEEMRG